MAPAPSTIDAMLRRAFDSAAIYFPFADVVGADPFKAFSQLHFRAIALPFDPILSDP
ncbi:DUF2092 domain-containing protein [Variovorax sp. J31P207]|uniref:DUF2092 domain-containing protein n=1 Tax=Variovorax sp. J31P207 TaxID=3053510 RepID=UPI0025751F93|nr:DUF2092 domain-containing protein [Variovorax sp. J31P207]MDM0072142.1 DUF2092 domain-containing protein [Variovorax sp. J31P207]